MSLCQRAVLRPGLSRQLFDCAKHRIRDSASGTGDRSEASTAMMTPFHQLHNPGGHPYQEAHSSLGETQIKDLGVDAATSHPVQRELVRPRHLIGSRAASRGWKTRHATQNEPCHRQQAGTAGWPDRFPQTQTATLRPKSCNNLRPKG